MPKTLKLLFVLADGGRARFVMRSGAGDYAVVKALDGTPALTAARAASRGATPGVVFESATAAPHGLRPKGVVQQAKAVFAAEVAGAAEREARRQGAAGLVLVAPARTLSLLRTHLGAASPVLASLAKDLGKTPAHELGRWLNSLELSAQAIARAA
ncbi:MAG: host attachment protein [Proteobacteria bacterium]|nr:host attachment protein [Pseudomonadota bacterium]